MLYGIALCLLLQVPAAHAAALEGRVIHVADGDTLTVLDEHNRQHRIRLAGIDAPERRQPFGKRATAELASLAKNKMVTVDWNKADRYHRLIGVVRVAPSGCAICKPSVDVGLELISNGLAWHYRAYAREQTVEERQQYRLAESAARAGHAGLWAEDSPMPPWDWRRARR
ncbi:MAG: thermonuclease family protein [Burkholderiales bacterium]|nr:thermonuclease family protein [Burkholderiales bacterium]